MGYTDHLTREERIARIGALLAKGVTLMLMREAKEKRQAEAQASSLTGQPLATDSVPGLDDEHRRILECLHRVGKASPREMQDGLELSKATLFRRLRELRQAGMVTRTGKSAAVRYRLDPRSAKQKQASAASDLPHGQTSGPNQP